MKQVDYSREVFGDEKVYKFGIVAIGYIKTGSFKRLLKALSDAEYRNHKDILLLISLDYSGDNTISDISNDFVWEYGAKKIIQHVKRLGLREHILKCGDYLNEYDLDSLIVFEDDVVPSRGFFIFAEQATEYYYRHDYVAGISLYSYRICPLSNRIFDPIKGNSDVFFMQFAMSWGQVWFRKQWNDFRQWYNNNCNWNEKCESIPSEIAAWPDSSWLKYHIKYCVEKKKYFVYPYNSHTTCFNEAGEHTKNNSDVFQVKLSLALESNYVFEDLSNQSILYDVYFENANICKVLSLTGTVEADLYGDKNYTYSEYLLSCRSMDYPLIKSWGSRMYPKEMNVVYDVPGEELHLYKLGPGRKELPSIRNENKKYESYFDLLAKWILLKNRNQNLARFFEERGIKKVAVYGWGKIGKLLYEELSKSTIHVACIIDEKNDNQDVISIEQFYEKSKEENVEALVITPYFEYDAIVSKICHETIITVISIESIIFDLYGGLEV